MGFTSGSREELVFIDEHLRKRVKLGTTCFGQRPYAIILGSVPRGMHSPGTRVNENTGDPTMARGNGPKIRVGCALPGSIAAAHRSHLGKWLIQLPWLLCALNDKAHSNSIRNSLYYSTHRYGKHPLDYATVIDTSMAMIFITACRFGIKWNIFHWSI